LAAAAIATVGDDDVAWQEHEELERFGGVPISDAHIDQASAQQVIAQMHPPVVSTAAGLLEPGGIDEQDARHAGRLAVRRRSCHRQQFAQQPEQPGACFAQVRAPCHMGEVG
jgi:hypothetical protein